MAFKIKSAKIFVFFGIKEHTVMLLLLLSVVLPDLRKQTGGGGRYRTSTGRGNEVSSSLYLASHDRSRGGRTPVLHWGGGVTQGGEFSHGMSPPPPPPEVVHCIRDFLVNLYDRDFLPLQPGCPQE